MLKLNVFNSSGCRYVAAPADMTARELIQALRASGLQGWGEWHGECSLTCPYAFGGGVRQSSEEAQFTLAALGVTNGYNISLSEQESGRPWRNYEGAEGRIPKHMRRGSVSATRPHGDPIVLSEWAEL